LATIYPPIAHYPLPVPDAVESDGDTDWDTFQTLISEQPKD
jgi:hypothetical protein